MRRDAASGGVSTSYPQPWSSISGDSSSDCLLENEQSLSGGSYRSHFARAAKKIERHCADVCGMGHFLRAARFKLTGDVKGRLNGAAPRRVPKLPSTPDFGLSRGKPKARRCQSPARKSTKATTGKLPSTALDIKTAVPHTRAVSRNFQS